MAAWMADVNVKRVGVGTPERMAADFTEGADVLSAFPWRAAARCCSLAASCRRVAVGETAQPARGCLCPRAGYESKRSLEGEAPRTCRERRPGWPP